MTERETSDAGSGSQVASARTVLSYQPLNEKAVEVHQAVAMGKKVTLMLGGRKAGKTHLGAYETMRQVGLNRPPHVGWITSPSYKSSLVPQRKMEEAISDLCGVEFKQADGKRVRIGKPTWKASERAWDFPNGYRLEIHTTENPDLLRGPALAWWWGDEAALYTVDCWRIMRPAMLMDGAQTLFTTTPRGRAHWLYSEIYEPSTRDSSSRYCCVKVKTRDNYYIKDVDYAELEKEYPGQWKLQELEGEFVEFSGLVYSKVPEMVITEGIWKRILGTECTIDRRSGDKILGTPPEGALIEALDFGLVNDPTAIVYIWKHGTPPHYTVVDEQGATGWSMDTTARNMRAWRASELIKTRYGDCRMVRELSELQARGLKIQPSDNHLVTTGIRHLLSLIEQGRLQVGTHCEELRKELSLYAWKEDKFTGEKKDEPIDRHNHYLDALRYGIVSDYMLTEQAGAKGKRKKRRKVEYKPLDERTGY